MIKKYTIFRKIKKINLQFNPHFNPLNCFLKYFL